MLASQTYPSGNTIGYSYDDTGRIAGITLTTANGSMPLLSDIQYQPFGKPTGWTWGNGTAYARSYDLNGRLTQFPLGATTGTGATPHGLSRTISYDAASRITAYTHADTSGDTGSKAAKAANQSFGYDDQDRLTSFLPAYGSQTYRYDANGNRTGVTIGGLNATESIDAASNRLKASMAGWMRMAYRYDTSGNLVSNGWVTYQYSDRGRLASATFVNVTTHYSYNALGQRVAKSGFAVPTGAVRYVYDEAGHLLGEYGRAGDAFQETVYLGDTPVVTIRNGEPYYIYADQIDTPRVITDTNNLMVWRWDQADPFGAMPPNMNPSGLGMFVYNQRFPGQVYDQETGKHYNANRDYDPLSGRYIQADPIGLKGGQLSTYSYVNGNPLGAKDPTGLVVGADDVAVGVGISEGVSAAASACAANPGCRKALADLLRAGVDVARAVVDACTSAATSAYNWMANEGGDSSGAGDKVDTLTPGQYAGDSIPARGPDRDFTRGERDKINEIGNDTGCHTCGEKDPGTVSGNFFPDHQPPNKINPPGGKQDLYPHCLRCSRRQGGQVRQYQ